MTTYNVSTNPPRESFHSEYFDSTIEFDRYSSFISSDNSAAQPNYLFQILPNQVSAIVLGQNTVRIHSYGGLSYGFINSDDPFLKTESQVPFEFTCGVLIRPPISKGDSALGHEIPAISDYLMTGTSKENAFLFDLSRVTLNGQNNIPLVHYAVPSPTVRMVSNGHVVALAGQDGGLLVHTRNSTELDIKYAGISLIDAKLRTANVVAHLEGHAGTVSDVALNSADGGRTLYSCGFSRRAINPYDIKSPFQVYYTSMCCGTCSMCDFHCTVLLRPGNSTIRSPYASTIGAFNSTHDANFNFDWGEDHPLR